MKVFLGLFGWIAISIACACAEAYLPVRGAMLVALMSGLAIGCTVMILVRQS